MASLMTVLKKNKGWAQVLGCGDAEIRHAQENLGMEFPADYKMCVRDYGTITFPGRFTWFGLNVVDTCDVVLCTNDLKGKSLNFPEKHFCLERFADGTGAIVNEKGAVFHLKSGEIVPLADSLGDYFVMRMTEDIVSQSDIDSHQNEDSVTQNDPQNDDKPVESTQNVDETANKPAKSSSQKEKPKSKAAIKAEKDKKVQDTLKKVLTTGKKVVDEDEEDDW